MDVAAGVSFGAGVATRVAAYVTGRGAGADRAAELLVTSAALLLTCVDVAGGGDELRDGVRTLEVLGVEGAVVPGR